MTTSTTTINATAATEGTTFKPFSLSEGLASLQAFSEAAKANRASFQNWLKEATVLLTVRARGYSAKDAAKIHNGTTKKGTGFMMATRKAEVVDFHREVPSQRATLDYLKGMRPQDILLECYFEEDPANKTGLTWYSSKVNLELFKTNHPARCRAAVKTHVVMWCRPEDVVDGNVTQDRVSKTVEDGGFVQKIPANAMFLREYVVLRVWSFGKVRPIAEPKPLTESEEAWLQDNDPAAAPSVPEMGFEEASFFEEMERGRMEMGM